MKRRRVLPDALAIMVSRVRRRWQLRSIALAIAVGGAAFAPALVAALSLFDASRTSALWIASLTGGGAAAWLAIANRRLSPLDAAKAIEATTGSLDNLVVTATELAERPRATLPEIRHEIDRQAAERLRTVDIKRVVPLAQPIALATAVVAGCVLLASVGGDSLASRAEVAGLNGREVIGPTSFTVTVSPPAYTRQGVEALATPVQVSVIAGSRIRIDTARGTLREWVAAASEGIEIRPDPSAEPRFLSVIVVPDASPSLRVLAPGRDTAFATAAGYVAITVEGGDDLGLSSMSLRFTKASGGGENLSFTDGEVALTIERHSDRHWRGRTTLTLEAMGLSDGDIVAYRAIARDTNPRGTPVQSEQYLIEIGTNAQIAAAGFSLPSEEKKHAISQQMVIYKTEQLLTGAEGSFLERSRLIGMEQRMVRAEVVFLGGGEVEDEVEEAAHSHELTEGRLQNTGRAEMLRAINAMSRAEALLNDGRAKEALVFEREALASLERALDRRRYFLRTLPDRSRIDVTRRLTGTRTEARSWLRDQASAAPSTSLGAHRLLMQELASAATTGANIDASLATRVAAIDPSAPELQKAAVAIASASNANGRLEAVRAAMQAVTAHALKSLPAATAIAVRRDALSGRLADELIASPRSRQ